MSKVRHAWLLLVACGAQGAVDEFAGLPDPTRPLNPEAQAETPAGERAGAGILDALRGFELTSILLRDNLRLAVVNSQRVAVGDEVGGARVQAIEPGRVVLELGGTTRVLTLHERTIKTPVTDRDRQE